MIHKSKGFRTFHLKLLNLLNEPCLIRERSRAMRASRERLRARGRDRVAWDFFRNSHRRCVHKKAVLKNFSVFTRKNLCLSLFLITFQVFRPVALSKRLQHRCFPVNIGKFSRTSFEEYLGTVNDCWRLFSNTWI